MPKASARRGASTTPTSKAGRAGAGGAKKQRWTSEQRTANGRAAERPRGGERRDERAGDARPARRYDADARPARRFDRDDRPARRDGDDRPARRYDRDERPARRDGDARPARRYDDAARPARRFDTDERPARRFDDDQRPARRYSDDARPARRFDRDERPARRDGDDRPARRYDRDERPGRRSTDDTRPTRAAKGERPNWEPRAKFGKAPRPTRGRDERLRDARPQRDGYRDGYAPRDRRDDEPREHFVPQEDVVLERLQGAAQAASDVDGVSFRDLGLGDNIVRELSALGAVTPFPIQAATIPEVLAGRDVLGRGRTGSGKTIAFGAPLVERLLQLNADRPTERRKPGRAPRAIILAPTRELALQIDRTVQPIARSVGLFTTQLYGGVPYARQYGALDRGVDIVIGTPGRIQDLVAQRRLDLSNIVVTVLDEADHMCDLGFLEPVQELLRQTPADSQRLLFSATLDSGVATLVDEFLREPSVHEVAGETAASATIEHHVFLMKQTDKRAVLAQLAEGDSAKLVFARTRAFAEELADMLEDDGMKAVSLHGDLNQARRTRNLERLTSGRVNVLVATDVAARGIHVDDIALVIQADAPDEYKTYLHRSGRTGRAGKDGIVVTLVPFNRRRRTEELLRRAEIDATWTEVTPGDDTIAELVARVNG